MYIVLYVHNYTVCNNIIVLHSNYINVNVYLKQGSRAHFRNKFISYYIEYCYFHDVSQL